MDKLLRHIVACNTARLPGTRRPLRIGHETVGFVTADLVQALGTFAAIRDDGDALRLLDPPALHGIVRGLTDAGWLRWRGEAFDVRAAPDGPALAQVDRGALPALGVMSLGAHVNGLVGAGEDFSIWIAVRAADKHLDPGKLDNLVAGGVPAGLTPDETLIKEAAEEADIPAGIAARAVPVARIAYAADRPEGLRRDLLVCYDLELPEDFTPHPADGEVARFELWPASRVLEAACDGEAFKFNVNLVLIDLFLRRGLIAGADAGLLRAALASPAPGAPGHPLD
jgi:8-oxo-dGTP pyrophosphatase MutT (NUDIX family)